MSTPFANVQPSTAELNAKNIEWRAALVKSDDGTKADTAYKNQVRAELEAMLTLQAQNCAELANGDLALYLTTGYEAKDIQGSPTGELGKVTGLEVVYGKDEGELRANWNTLTDARNYTWHVFTDSENPDGTIVKMDIVQKSKAIISGLPSGAKVWVRVRGNGGSTGHGQWSNAFEIRVP